MKISQEDVILIKNLYLSKQYGARRLLSELSDKGWELGSIDSLLNKSHKRRMQGVWKNHNFQSISRFVLETIPDMSYSYNDRPTQ